MKQTGKRS